MQIVSFFAGCGGLDLGFEQAGFQVIWANEFEPHCQATYTHNHPNTKFVLGDICKIASDEIPNCDGFIGGPPCQSWSVGGKQRGLDDERGQLFLKYIELINSKRPKFFVIENVKGMLDDKFKDVFGDFLIRLNDAGYNVQWALLDAVNYGIPQNRERVFIVGFRKELDVVFTFPTPTCINPITLEKAIGDISENPNGFSDGIYKITRSNSHYANHDVLTSKFGPFYYRGNRRRGWHQPSFTINATADFAPLHPSSPKMIFFGHENWNFQKDRMNEYRRMSVRECARIQSFPDDFIFYYDDIKNAYKMIGNAVPPQLGYVIAKSIHDALRNTGTVLAGTQFNAKDIKDETVLVGYYKGSLHKQLILKNQLYYVRSDGRKGSMFQSECSVIPKYLLLHNKNADIYELEDEEPILADASFLKTLGFETSGETYLCFRLKKEKSKEIRDNVVFTVLSNYKWRSYSPYFATIENLLDEIKHEC